VGSKIGDGLELKGMFRGASATLALLYGQKREPGTKSVILDVGLPRLFYPQQHDIVNRYQAGATRPGGAKIAQRACSNISRNG